MKGSGDWVLKQLEGQEIVIKDFAEEIGVTTQSIYNIISKIKKGCAIRKSTLDTYTKYLEKNETAITIVDTTVDKYYLNIAEAIAKEKEKGCLLVSNNNIISTGYTEHVSGTVSCICNVINTVDLADCIIYLNYTIDLEEVYFLTMSKVSCVVCKNTGSLEGIEVLRKNNIDFKLI